MSVITVSTFYKFFENKNASEMQVQLKTYCVDQGIKGIIILAKEGLNATISGDSKRIKEFFVYFKENWGIEFDNIKNSTLDYHPFNKTKVKLKKEIVTLGLPNISGLNAGSYVKPEEWDDFIDQEDVVLIDTRNEYETAIGSFKGAIIPKTENFNDFPQWFEENKESLANKKVAMCCTGGIRCEKSTAYLKSQGLQEVYHLEGGILNYLMKLGENAKKWYGDCFVFDQRLAVNKKIEQVFNTKVINPAEVDSL